MNEELSVLTLVVERLEAAQIDYMVTGSLAVSVYAEPRMTRDVDLVVALESADAVRLDRVFAPEFECNPERVREAILHRTMFNAIHIASVVKIDVIVRKDAAYRLEEFRRRRRADVGGVRMWVVTAEDLVLSKLDWARTSRSDVQLRDVRAVIRAQAALDWRYLDHWAARLGVADLLLEARS